MTRVLVTGGSGFVGGAVVRDLLAHGHEVVGLARSENAAAKLQHLGADVLRGSLEDLDVLRDAAAAAEGAVHMAFDNSDLSRFAENGRAERAALEALGQGLADGNRPMVLTSGFLAVSPGRVATENDGPVPGAASTGRDTEGALRALIELGVAASLVRLPCVHGDGDRFTVPMLAEVARRTGVSAYIGDGANRWPAVHVDDAASVYRLALGSGAVGARWHAVAEEGVHAREAAAVLGRSLSLPVQSVSAHDAWAHFGVLSLFAGADLPASSVLTRSRLQWSPTGPGLLADIGRPGYHRV